MLYTVFAPCLMGVFTERKKKKGNVKMNKIISMVLAVVIMICATSVSATAEGINSKESLQKAISFTADILLQTMNPLIWMSGIF